MLTRRTMTVGRHDRGLLGRGHMALVKLLIKKGVLVGVGMENRGR